MPSCVIFQRFYINNQDKNKIEFYQDRYLTMSCSYAEGLSEYHDKGKLGLPEKFDVQNEINEKVKLFTEWVKNAKHIVVHTGK